LREKIISLELSNAEDDMESITGTGASDAESESEDTTEQNIRAVNTNIMEEKIDSHDTTNITENITSAKTNPNITVASTKKKKRKRSKKGRH